MQKRVIDISPPGSGPRAKIRSNFKFKDSLSGAWFKKLFSTWSGRILVIAVVLVLFFAVFTARAQLQLTLFPRLEDVSLSETIEVRAQNTEIGVEQPSLPGQFFEAEVEVSEQFKATGSSDKGGSASGTITVFNEYNPPTPVRLVAETRFLSSEAEKVFRSIERIHIPPAKIKDGKVLAGTVDIKVKAAEPGPEYNIPPSKFSVPGLVGSSLYYYIYGESKASMEGGFESEVKIVRSQDLDNARQVISEALLKKGAAVLAEKAGSDMIILEEAVSQISGDEKAIECLATQGMETSEFSCQGKTRVKGLGFKEADLRELARKIAISGVPSQTKLAEHKLTVQFSNPAFVLEKGKLVFDAEIEASYYKEIALDMLRAQIVGRGKEDIKETVFARYPQVKDVELQLSPFWMWRAPKNQDRIEARIDY